MKTERWGTADRVLAWLGTALLCVLASHALPQGSGAADSEPLETLSNVQPTGPALSFSSSPGASSSLFVPVILTASGLNNSFFTSELTLTNRGDREARLEYTYTAHAGGGSGTATGVLAPGQQRIQMDALEHLRELGIPIPKSGNYIGTLRVEFAGFSDVSVSVRTITSVPEGRAGLAYPGIALADGFTEAVYLCGLRQNSQDRSNVAVQNMGGTGQGNVTLRTTLYSGEAESRSAHVLPDVMLVPGGFHQYNGILDRAGFDNGYVKVERVEGAAPFYAYGVINDQANSDGSFVFPVTASSLTGTTRQTLPVIVETGVFTSELMVTNFSDVAKTVTFRFRAEGVQTPDKTALIEWTFHPGQQVIVPEIVEVMRQMRTPGIGLTGQTFAGALFASVAEGDMSGIVIGARTSSSDGRGGQYGVFYNAVPDGGAFTESVWVDSLQQNEENRSNLALVNTGEVDGSPSVFQLDIYDGETGTLANTVTGLRVAARGWRQINGILGEYAPGTTQGYVRIRKISGNNPFLAYGVINDGGAPGQRSGDGAYLPAMEERTRDPGTVAMTDREVLEAFYHATGGPNWNNRTNWLSALPLSEWYGVETDGSGRVTSLSLGRYQKNVGNNLTGVIPPELGRLTHLRVLFLGVNQLSGAIPPELGQLTNLKQLDLGGNLLSGAIPRDLQQLSRLATFDFRDTDVCVPTGDAFQAWLDTLARFWPSGLICDGTRQVLFSASSYAVREGEAVTVAVRLIDQTGDPVGSAEIALTAAPGAGATTADYSGVAESVTVVAPANEASFVFRAARDEIVDDRETVVLRFQRPLPSGITAGDPDTATVTIHEPGTAGVTERDVLEAFYHATGGPDWSDRTNWLSDAPLSNWYGVKTDGSGRVTHLSLEGNRLSGPIPPELAALTHLRELSLWENELSGPIPPELGELPHLRWLFLQANHLSGPIPPELASLTKLQQMALARNQLSGAIPRALGQLSRLQRLYLGANQLSGAIPSELGQLTHLQVLAFGDNQLSGAIPPELGGLPHLQYLYLTINHLSGPVPPELATLTSLRWLFAAGNQLSGAIPPELGGLTHLARLDLRGNQLSGTIPSELGQLTHLQQLRLSFNQDLTGTIPLELQSLPLSTLDLMATSVCVPEDAESQEWLATIEFFTPSGLTCGRPAAVMSSIDVAVVYTPTARKIAGGKAALEAKIDLMVAETNRAYVESGVNQQIALVAREEVEYTESGNTITDIVRFADPSDGHMDEIHTMRNQAGADLVHLIADSEFSTAIDIPSAFGLTCARCDSSSFAHELGHNMGLYHDRYASPRIRGFPYSRGYVNQRAFAAGVPASARWRTIMAYHDQCSDADFGCDWIMRFSNPNQTYRGDPLGVSGDERTTAPTGPADAVRTLNITRHSVASFRARVSENRLTLSSSVPQGGGTVAPPPVQFAGGAIFQPIGPNGGGAASRQGGSVGNHATLRRREVSVDIGSLARVGAGGSTTLRLNLFDDLTLTGIIEQRTPTYSGGYALSGRLAGISGASVTLVVNGSMVAGTVRLPSATFRIRPTGPGRHAIMQVDPSKLPQGCEVVRQTTHRER